MDTNRKDTRTTALVSKSRQNDRSYDQESCMCHGGPDEEGITCPSTKKSFGLYPAGICVGNLNRTTLEPPC